MSKSIMGLISLIAMAHCATAQAQDRTSGDTQVDRYEQGNWAVGVAISTMGIGPEAAVRLHPNAIFRISTGYGDGSSLASHFTFSTGSAITDGGGGNFTSQDTKYTGTELNVMGARALLDWHPFRDGGRVSIGAGYLDVSGSAMLATRTGNVKVGDGVYTPAQAKGMIFKFANTDNIMGYTGLGYDNAFFKDYGLSISSDFGVFWGYTSDVTLSGGTITGADRTKEQSALKTKLDNLPVYPVISLSAKYRF
ncbi:MAG: hypothetical protein ABL901_17465 [Hyphomicrobiaceae bacterium]